MRRAKIFVNETWAGTLTEDENGYHFQYRDDYLKTDYAESVSLTLPLLEKPFHSTSLFPFFDGLIPEGWLLEIAQRSWKINPRDRMGLLLAACRDCIGAVSVFQYEEDQND